MKIVNNILFAVMLSAGNCFAIYGRESDDKDNYPHTHSRSECHVPGHYGHGGRTLRDCCPQYIISNGRVYFDGREVKDASASGFKSLPDGYALHGMCIIAATGLMVRHRSRSEYLDMAMQLTHGGYIIPER